MSEQKHWEKGKPGRTARQGWGQRTSNAQIPPEMADHLPPGITVTQVALTQAEIFALARRVEPEVTRWLAEKPAKNPLEALLLMVQAMYALLQPPELPVL